MKTIDLLYKPVLDAVDLTVDESGNVMRGKEPWTVSGLPVILPTRENTQEMAEDKVYFHPLSEDFFIGGQSNVLKRLKKSMLIAMDKRFLVLAIELAVIAANLKGHEKLNPKQQALIRFMPKLQVGHAAAFSRWVRTLTPDATGAMFMTLFLKENLSVEGHRYKRGAMLRFTLAEEMQRLANEGVALDKFTRAETATIAGVLTYMLQPWAETYSQEFGSDNSTAPYFAALLEAFTSMAERLNYMHELFWPLSSPTYQEKYPDPKILLKHTWAQPAEWAKFFREIPPLAYNRGNEEQEAKPAIPQYEDRDTVKAKVKPVIAAYEPKEAPVANVANTVAEKPAAPLTENRGGVKVINLSDLPGGNIPQYDAWGRPIQVNNSTFYQQPVANTGFAQPTAPVANNAPTFICPRTGNLIDARGNILALAATAPVANTGFSNGNTGGWNSQPVNTFSQGPFTNQQPQQTGFNNGGWSNGNGGWGSNTGGFGGGFGNAPSFGLPR